MSILSTVLLCLSIGIFVFGTLKALSDIMTRVKMRKKERLLRSKGVSPFGSALSHGMVYNSKTRKIEADHKESITWYRRLIN